MKCSYFTAVFPNFFDAADLGPHKTKNGNFLYFTHHKIEEVTYNFTTLNVSFMTIEYCYKWSLFGRLRTYPRCEEHDKIKFNENKLLGTTALQAPVSNFLPINNVATRSDTHSYPNH
jgi:hypothetical protein